MGLDTGKQELTDKKIMSKELELELQGVKLKFGNKTFDPSDPHIRKPHSRVVPFKDSENIGGLLQTGGHRPVVPSKIEGNVDNVNSKPQ